MPMTSATAHNRLPSDVYSLYDRLVDVSRHRGIIPGDVRQYVEALGVDPSTPSIFRESESTSPAAPAAAKAILDKLYGITKMTASSIQQKRHKCGWNHFVHGALLDLVYANGHLDDVFDSEIKHDVAARWEPVMAATIEYDCIPLVNKPNSQQQLLSCPVEPSDEPSADDASRRSATTSISQSNLQASTKQVDYCLVLDTRENTCLARTISDLLFYMGDRRRHVNQTTYQPLCKHPIAVSIETKKLLSKTAPSVQVGLWFAAWHKRMYQLRTNLIAFRQSRGQMQTSAELPRLVSIPLITITGPYWELSFACDVGSQIHMYGPISIGSTSDLTSIYVLISALEAVRDWIQGTFYKSMTEWFICDTPDVPLRS
ncbi:hypothetical protein F5Y18DRAFT_54228 [Xylariaceae sp. FL1019]|nr:hypothetical protein F5Y18DRAFT_54228 [Xylariaceae sp. FL1019]